MPLDSVAVPPSHEMGANRIPIFKDAALNNLRRAICCSGGRGTDRPHPRIAALTARTFENSRLDNNPGAGPRAFDFDGGRPSASLTVGKRRMGAIELRSRRAATDARPAAG